MRITEATTLVRILRCWCWRSVSRLSAVLEIGKPSDTVPQTSTLVACISMSWPFAMLFTTRPQNFTQVPVLAFARKPRHDSLSEKLASTTTTCKDSGVEPSFSSTKFTAACWRIVRIQPPTSTTWPSSGMAPSRASCCKLWISFRGRENRKLPRTAETAWESRWRCSASACAAESVGTALGAFGAALGSLAAAGALSFFLGLPPARSSAVFGPSRAAAWRSISARIRAASAHFTRSAFFSFPKRSEKLYWYLSSSIAAFSSASATCTAEASSASDTVTPTPLAFSSSASPKPTARPPHSFRKRRAPSSCWEVVTLPSEMYFPRSSLWGSLSHFVATVYSSLPAPNFAWRSSSSAVSSLFTRVSRTPFSFSPYCRSTSAAAESAGVGALIPGGSLAFPFRDGSGCGDCGVVEMVLHRWREGAWRGAKSPTGKERTSLRLNPNRQKEPKHTLDVLSLQERKND
eukprot:RCo029456